MADPITNFKNGVGSTSLAAEVTTTAEVVSRNNFVVSVRPLVSSAFVNAAVWARNNNEGPGEIFNSGHNIGVLGWAENNAGTCVLTIGTEGKVVGNGGTITNAVALEANIVQTAGVIGNAIGVQSHLGGVPAGTVAHLIGYYFPDQSAYGVSDRKAIRVDDPGAPITQIAATGGAYMGMGGRVGQVITPAAAGAGLTIPMALSITAGTLKRPGDRLISTVYFQCANNADTKNIGLKLGPNSSYLSPQGAYSNLIGVVEGTTTYLTSTTQTVIFTGMVGTSVLAPQYNADTAVSVHDVDYTVYVLTSCLNSSNVTVLGLDVVYVPASVSVN